MDRTVSRIGLATGAAGLLAAAFTQIYAPLRAKRLAAHFARFRAEHQAEHDAIDAQFNQQDRVVNGLNWHYLQLQAAADPTQPMWRFRDVATLCPNVKLEWVTGAGHYDNFDRPEQVAEAINRFVHATSAAGRALSSGF